MNYRKLYEKECKIRIPKGFEIHHIDMNRSNNDIMNLVMLPKELHNLYHTKLENLKYIHLDLTTNLQSTIDMGHMVNEYIVSVELEKIKGFVSVWYECMRFVDYRNYLLGIIPIDLHNMGEKIYGDNQSK